MISVVIPLFNEEDSLLVLHKSLQEHLKNVSYELIFIDDGSKDDSLSILQKIAQKDKRVLIFSFRKNLGKSEALMLGFSKARGEHVVTMDADLQDQPFEIPQLLKKLDEGWDVVCGWRKNRQDAKSKIISSFFFNFFVRKMWGLYLHDYNCGLKTFRKQAAKSLNLYGGLHRFIPLLLYQQGFRVCEVEVVHGKRKFGKSKFGFSKIWRDLPDMLTMFFLTRYGERPLHFFGSVGGVIFGIGFFILGYLTYLWFLGESIGRRPLLLFGVLLVLGGLQVLFTGFLADLIINVFKKRVIDRDGIVDNRLKYIS